MNYYIGIDLGTSAVKALLVDENGNVINSLSKSYDLSFPHPFWSEENPLDWYNQSLEAIKDVISGVDKKCIKSISFGGQMHGLVILDDKDNVIRPAILWNDGRTTKEVEYLNKTIGEQTLIDHVGNIAFAGFTAPKVLWVKENEPESFKRISKIMLPKDYLAYRFTGVFATDYSDAAGTLYLDVKNKVWSKFMLDLLGINEKVLPKLYESYEVIGALNNDIADKLGLDTIKVIIGGGDNAAAAIGTGCVNPGDCNISLGTSGTVFYASDKFKADVKIPIHSFNHANGGYHLMGCILAAASCNKWWVEDILKSTYSEITGNLDKYLGKSNVLFAPYLMGERCPYNDPLASGALFNVRMNTSREEISIGILEGVAFAIKDCVELIKEFGLPINKVTICGGGCNTKVWPIIISNVLNMPINFVETEQGPGYGGALLAMVGDNKYENVAAACKQIVKIKDTVKPSEELAQFYSQKYSKYKKLYKAIKSID